MPHTSSAYQIVLGIDPGFDRVGWAIGVISKGSLTIQEFGCIETSKRLNLSERYLQIAEKLENIIAKHHPTVLAIEELYFAKNQTSALKVSEARGVILTTCVRQGLALHEYHPQHVKQAVTGYGKADKAAMKKMIALQLKLQTTGVLDDAIDAVGLVLTHSVLGSQPLRQSTLQ